MKHKYAPIGTGECWTCGKTILEHRTKRQLLKDMEYHKLVDETLKLHVARMKSELEVK